jgi:hypothetical protein
VGAAAVANKYSKIEDLRNFLTSRCQVLETVETKPTTVSNAKSANSGNKHKQTPNSHSNTFLTTETNSKCFLCNSDSHYIFKCNVFLKLTVSGRFKEVKRLKLCTNCFAFNGLSVISLFASDTNLK